jgi:hypothetical protein
VAGIEFHASVTERNNCIQCWDIREQGRFTWPNIPNVIIAEMKKLARILENVTIARSYFAAHVARDFLMLAQAAAVTIRPL